MLLVVIVISGQGVYFGVVGWMDAAPTLSVSGIKLLLWVKGEWTYDYDDRNIRIKSNEKNNNNKAT